MSKVFRYISAVFAILFVVQMLPSWFKTVKNEYSSFLENRPELAKVKLEGEISNIEDHIKTFQNFFEDKDVKGILFEIESGGGASGASQALFSEIKKLKAEHPKPLVVLTNNICASGAYYAACAADYIICSPASLIGSVGSYVGYFKLKDFIENWKVQYDVKKSGEYKTAGNLFTEMNSEQEKMLQELSDDIYSQFTKDVSISRKLLLKDEDKWANGRIFTGKQALALKLVDENGSNFNAIKKLKELALIDKDQKVKWVKAADKGFFDKLMSGNLSKTVSRVTESILTQNRIFAIS